MAEENPAAGQAPDTVGVDPVAAALALCGAGRAEADAYLRNQNSLIDIQKHHLHEQFKQVRLGTWEKRLGVLLRVATAFTGLAVAAGLAFMVWQATQSGGLLIEPFSVPPDLAASGLTGEVVATKVLDRLVAMQAQTSSQRAPKSYADSWDEKAIKLDLPETGVSLTELDNFLRQKLGHDLHVSGEVVRQPQGISLTARTAGQAADSVAGPPEQMDGLVQHLAESIYRMTQPYRYGVYLTSHGRSDEALPVLALLAKSGSAEDRPWAYNLLALLALDRTGVTVSNGLMHKAMAVDPAFVVSQVNIARYQAELSHAEEALAQTRKLAALSSGGAQNIILPRFVPVIHTNALGEIDLLLGAFHDAAQKQAIVVASGIPGRWGLSDDLARAQSGEHDLAAARATLADPVPDAGLVPGAALLYRHWAWMILDNEAGAWAQTLAQAQALKAELAPYPGESDFLPTLSAPLAAYAQARLGRFADADATLAATSAGCYDCLRARARIAALKGDQAGADGWFARAVALGPDSPFAETDWGRALLDRGKPEEAIAKFAVASRKGPHFADPLEYWGEALMAKNQSHLALAKFTEAQAYAPNWGRLHLKWGEALAYAGKRDQAKAQFARAAQLDLTPSEKAELARNF